jgi:riboflavin kinase/FMN adenylyltransferase
VLLTIDLTDSGISPEKCTVTALGLFDGLHLGHRGVIERAVSIAAEHDDAEPAVFTFKTDTVSSKESGGVLFSDEIKMEIMGEMGVKYIYSPDFALLRDYSAEDFAEKILLEKLNAKYVVCGYDFRFGKNAAGDTDLLKKLCGKHGAKVITVPPVKSESGERISSTAVRELIREGNVRKAAEMLGFDYFLKLPVKSGNRIGRTIDFPTINQQLPRGQVVPKYGVYASLAEFDGRTYRGVTNIGIKPTIMDFDGDLYGKTVKLSLIDFVRPERKFDSIEELKMQIQKDVSSVKNT